MSRFGSPKCARCGKSAYANESTNFATKIWHTRGCFSCKACGKGLQKTNAKPDKDNEIFCPTCYSKNYGPVGFRGGGAQGGVGNWNKKDTDQVKKAVKKSTTSSSGGGSSGGGSSGGGSSGGKIKFCSECGAKASSGKFCAECGHKF